MSGCEGRGEGSSCCGCGECGGGKNNSSAHPRAELAILHQDQQKRNHVIVALLRQVERRNRQLKKHGKLIAQYRRQLREAESAVEEYRLALFNICAICDAEGSVELKVFDISQLCDPLIKD